MSQKILILDDNKDITSNLSAIFEQESGSANIKTANTYDEAVALVLKHEFDDAIIDVCLREPDRDGAKFANELKKIQPDCRIHILTGIDDYRVPEGLEYDSIHGKPVLLQEIRNTVYGRRDDTGKISTRLINLEYNMKNNSSDIECLRLSTENTAIEVNQVRGEIDHILKTMTSVTDNVSSIVNSIKTISDENKIQFTKLDSLEGYLRTYPFKVIGMVTGFFAVAATVLVAVIKI